MNNKKLIILISLFFLLAPIHSSFAIVEGLSSTSGVEYCCCENAACSEKCAKQTGVCPTRPISTTSCPMDRCAPKSQPTTQEDVQSRLVAPTLQIPIPTIKPFTVKDVKLEGTVGDRYVVVPFIAQYVVGVYKYGISVAFIVAIVIVMIAGFRWMTSGGNASIIGQAKEMMSTTFIGLLLLFGSYVLLNTINPDLLNSGVVRIKYIEPEYFVVDTAQAASGETGTGTNNIPYFAQYDAAWGNKKPGDSGWPLEESRTDCTTIRQRGCGTTSLAMVLKNYGVNTTPLETAAWGLGCTGGWQPKDTVPKLSSKWPGIGGEIIYKNGIDRVFDLLRAGKPLIYNCAPCSGQLSDGSPQPTPYNGHYMVLTGFDSNGNITVNDPGRNSQKRTAWFTEAQIRKEFKVAVHIYRGQ